MMVVFVGVVSFCEIVFICNVSEVINLVVCIWGDVNFKKGDEIFFMVMEYYSNLVLWQLLVQCIGCVLCYVGIIEFGELDFEDFWVQFNECIWLVSLVYISNFFGCCNFLDQVIFVVYVVGVCVFVDVCQSLVYKLIDVVVIDVDFFVGFFYKFCGFIGMGFFWVRELLLEVMFFFLGGGEMIQDVYLDYSIWVVLFYKFEVGIFVIGEVVGMGVVICYLQVVGLELIQVWEVQFIWYLFIWLQVIDGVRVLGLMLD